MQIKIAAPHVDLTGATLIAGVMTDLVPVPGSETAFFAVDSVLLDLAKFEGKTGQILALPHESAAVLLLVGLGDEASFESLRSAVGNGIRAVKTVRAVTTLNQVPIEAATRAVVEGLLLGGYEYRQYKTSGEGAVVEIVELIEGNEAEIAEAMIGAEVTTMARDWVNTPALDMSPETLAARITSAAGDAGVGYEIWDLARIQDEGLGALLGVAAGSDRDPSLVVLEYQPEKPRSHLGLVGKGITFDTGGLSIKAAPFMEEMKDDMSGAAVVAAATIGIARLELPIRVTAVIPITDNAVGGNATRPGDVLRPIFGPTIEVLNTDAEGRLILADGLGVMRRYEPDLVVDVATLTGAARVALGDRIAAVFGSESDVAAQVLRAASRAGEDFWELPLFTEYRKQLDSDIADIKNITASRYGGAIAAAVFLAEYAGDGHWAHLDIAGPARARETMGEQVKGASGFGARTLIELAKAMEESV
ncbi:MAG: leucyl aminopeptidase [Actinomycetota bacterium]|nr:leucyl aminopeptidase [Actinomycetota bacterium]